MNNVKVREFRLTQSQDKLAIAKKLYIKGDNTHALLQAYLSIFYSVRILLLDKDSDSDDFKRIIELSRSYLMPSGWMMVDIAALLEQGRNHQQLMASESKYMVHAEDAKKFIDWILGPDGQKLVVSVGYFPVR